MELARMAKPGADAATHALAHAAALSLAVWPTRLSNNEHALRARVGGSAAVQSTADDSWVRKVPVIAPNQLLATGLAQCHVVTQAMGGECGGTGAASCAVGLHVDQSIVL